jgi:hypothetical protein
MTWMRDMRYAVFEGCKLLSLYDSLPKAIASLPKGGTHIFDTDKDIVFFFKRGRFNGKNKNKR